MNILQQKMKTIKMQRSDSVKENFQKYLPKTTIPITIKETQINTLKQLGVLVPYHQITSYIKSSLQLRYKKGSSITVQVDFQIVYLCKNLFCIRLVNKLRRVRDFLMLMKQISTRKP